MHAARPQTPASNAGTAPARASTHACEPCLGQADRVIYGRGVRDAHAKAKSGMVSGGVSEIADLPLSGAGTYANVAGLRSRKMTEGGLGTSSRP